MRRGLLANFSTEHPLDSLCRGMSLPVLADEKQWQYYGISGRQAEKLLREFYGLPEAGAAAPAAVETATTDSLVLDLSDFL